MYNFRGEVTKGLTVSSFIPPRHFFICRCQVPGVRTSKHTEKDDHMAKSSDLPLKVSKDGAIS